MRTSCSTVHEHAPAPPQAGLQRAPVPPERTRAVSLSAQRQKAQLLGRVTEEVAAAAISICRTPPRAIRWPPPVGAEGLPMVAEAHTPRILPASVPVGRHREVSCQAVPSRAPPQAGGGAVQVAGNW